MTTVRIHNKKTGIYKDYDATLFIEHINEIEDNAYYEILP